MNFKILLGGMSLVATSVAAYLSIPPTPKPTRDWNKVTEDVKQECGNGNEFHSTDGKEQVNDKGLTMKGYEDCKQKIYNGPS